MKKNERDLRQGWWHEQPKYHGVWSQVQGGTMYPTLMTLIPPSTNISRLVGCQLACLLHTWLLSVFVSGTFPSDASLGNFVPFDFRCQCVPWLLRPGRPDMLLFAGRGFETWCLQETRGHCKAHSCCYYSHPCRQCSEAGSGSKTLPMWEACFEQIDLFADGQTLPKRRTSYLSVNVLPAPKGTEKTWATWPLCWVTYLWRRLWELVA